MERKNKQSFGRTLISTLSAGVLGLSLLGISSDAYSQGYRGKGYGGQGYEEPVEKIRGEVKEGPRTILNPENLDIPEKLTQQTPDFYKNPHKEFEFYRDVYKNLSKDGVINAEGIRSLEIVLGKTLIEIDSKLWNKHKGLKESLPNNDEVDRYKEFVENIRPDLNRFRVHLKRREKWQELPYVKETTYWHHGSGARMYFDQNHKGKGPELRSSFSNSPVYKTSKEVLDSTLLNKSKFKTPAEVLIPSEESPIQTKIPYWLGFLGGIFVPGLMAGAGILRKRVRGKKINDNDWIEFWGTTLGNAAPGFLVLDSLHPLVYPTRLALPILYEAGQWAFGKRDYSGSNKDNEEDVGGKDSKEKRGRRKAPELPADFIDPWSINIENKGEK